MNKQTIHALAASLLVAAVAVADEGLAVPIGVTLADQEVIPPGVVVGRIFSFVTGIPVSGATITDGYTTVVSDKSGAFKIGGLPPGEERVLTVRSSGFALASRYVLMGKERGLRQDIGLQPVAVLQELPDLKVPRVVEVPGLPASITLPAESLVVRRTGARPVFPVVAALTPLDPSGNRGIMPGSYRTGVDTFIESFGAMDIVFTDAKGEDLDLAPGVEATVRIPAIPNIKLPETSPTFIYEAKAGIWQEAGKLILDGSKTPSFQGNINRVAPVNADKPFPTTCLTGRVVDGRTGRPVSEAIVVAEGISYISENRTLSGPDGSFTMLVRANAQVRVYAEAWLTGTAPWRSQDVIVNTGLSPTPCTVVPELLRLMPPAQVSGRVLDAETQAVDDTSWVMASGAGFWNAVRVDLQGQFALQVPAQQTLAFKASNAWAQSPAFFWKTPVSGTDAVLPEPLMLGAARTGLAGQVIDAAGVGVTSAWVTAMQPNGRMSFTQSGLNGFFTLPWVPSKQDVIVQARKGSRVSKPMPVSTGTLGSKPQKLPDVLRLP